MHCQRNAATDRYAATLGTNGVVQQGSVPVQKDLDCTSRNLKRLFKFLLKHSVFQPYTTCLHLDNMHSTKYKSEHIGGVPCDNHCTTHHHLLHLCLHTFVAQLAAACFFGVLTSVCTQQQHKASTNLQLVLLHVLTPHKS